MIVGICRGRKTTGVSIKRETVNKCGIIIAFARNPSTYAWHYFLLSLYRKSGLNTTIHGISIGDGLTADELLLIVGSFF